MSDDSSTPLRIPTGSTIPMFSAPPSWDTINAIYSEKWEAEKKRFRDKLLSNLHALVSQYKSGKQEIYELNASNETKFYEQVFREVFSESAWCCTVGEVERLGTGGKRVRRLFITLPTSFELNQK